ncbi:MAG: VOC family protein [Bacteroidia bacterium]|nr:VOC family protein [Bacteroidia bacterium]
MKYSSADRNFARYGSSGSSPHCFKNLFSNKNPKALTSESNDRYLIAGIQQIGLGVPDTPAAFAFYRKLFGADIPVINESAEAKLMLPYTGGKPHRRHAILAININGGGGFEIWQYISRKPVPPSFEVRMGDLGFNLVKIKCMDVHGFHRSLAGGNAEVMDSPSNDPAGQPRFHIRDPWGTIFEITGSADWFSRKRKLTGGTCGSIIGVSDMEKSMRFYSEILGYDKVIYDTTGVFADLAALPGGTNKFRRVLIGHSKPREGAFSRLLGSSTIELIRVLDREPRKIYENRWWGDQGIIHLSFDIANMEALRRKCEQMGSPFTVDSGAGFEMGSTAGHFSYIEDPDGTLIEFVETKKLPILKALGWNLDLRKRDRTKPLPDWMLKTLSFSRVKD